jgi:hypothetical protein
MGPSTSNSAVFISDEGLCFLNETADYYDPHFHYFYALNFVTLIVMLVDWHVPHVPATDLRATSGNSNVQ